MSNDTIAGDESVVSSYSAVTSGDSADDRIVRQLQCLSDDDDDYWAFRRRAVRNQAHGITQYPAMMVPSMQAKLISVVSEIDGTVDRVLDPFAGSGTTLVECMRLGLDYSGQDINPLAILICRTKAGPFLTDVLESAIKAVIERAGADRGERVEADFTGIEKWFCPNAINDLSRIRRAIRQIDNIWCRRVLWTSLAETVRLTSNSRTSTFKLHVRSADDLESRSVDPFHTFAAIVSDVNTRLVEEAEALREGGHITKDGCYRGDVVVELGDSTKSVPALNGEHDMLLTSPPYGDNTTTVPYGQYSFLPLQWIDLRDIDENADFSYLRSTHEIDTRSIGGSRKNAVQEVQDLLDVSPSLRETLNRLEQLPADRAKRVAGYYRDLAVSLDPVLNALRRDAYMIWTVGNRSVGGKPVPTDAILEELLNTRGSCLVAKIHRKIPSKRMATRNAISSTMRKESILVFRKE